MMINEIDRLLARLEAAINMNTRMRNELFDRQREIDGDPDIVDEAEIEMLLGHQLFSREKVSATQDKIRLAFQGAQDDA
jgi:hypothetical protein